MINCSVKGCVFPSFAKDKITRLPYCSSHQYLRTDTDKRSPLQKHLDKQKNKNKTASVKTSVRSLMNTTQNKVVKEKSELRSELLMLADKLFGNFVKKRDQDENGCIICPCCKKQFHVSEFLEDGGKVVQPLHFIDRDVYVLRYSERNTNAGCCWCNKKQHDSPNGLEFHNYKQFLVDKYGKAEVEWMISCRRQINKLTHADLQLVIETYKPQKQNNDSNNE